VIVHSKVLVVDDRYARIGSANLNNRSGGFDTECDLTFEATTEAHRTALVSFRDGLISHFVARSAADFAEARGRYGGLVAAVDALDRERLLPIELPKMSPFGELIAAHHLGDPATVHDSWRPLRRRETLYARVRQAASEISTTRGR
jgi:phosphatidylserine/phosphatidylglycerophosphate/cardiolipin synthase-like enzyme